MDKIVGATGLRVLPQKGKTVLMNRKCEQKQTQKSQSFALQLGIPLPLPEMRITSLGQETRWHKST
jgi:hypothetical protein